MDEDNVFKFSSVKGGKAEEDPGFPVNDYIIVDLDDEEFAATGFLVFTTHHVAIMKTTKDGAVPSLVLPIGRVKFAAINDEDEVQESFPL